MLDPFLNDVTQWVTDSLEPLADETPIPEPGTLVVVAGALVVLSAAGRRFAGSWRAGSHSAGGFLFLGKFGV